MSGVRGCALHWATLHSPDWLPYFHHYVNRCFERATFVPLS
ncbi:unnamed protein product [Chondrus crispus]|uniref:Uncharacterized protein n=1 Tax=Chondrus crispus TaxID=2769 RepID=R7Q504_CHOCR|nr:unnamed protein product [Chondrus crispus]CDF32943.1 unnamed protein product [Chondrus crispus]|eukprot:XP_005712746.1 unnamed protein product [Chondrus crispus]